MKKLFKLLFALLMGAMMFSACSNDDSENLPEQNEVTVDVIGLKDTSVTIACLYHPRQSVMYQLRVGNTVSEEYTKDKWLKILHLLPNKDYTLMVTIKDVNHKAIGRSEVKFKTDRGITGSEQFPIDETVPSAIVFEETEER